MTRFLQLRLTGKVLFLVGLSVVATAAIMGTIASTSMRSELLQRVILDQDKNMRMAAEVLARAHPETMVQHGADGSVRLSLASLPAPGGHEIVDAVSRVTGNTATIFAWDGATEDFVRKTTSVKKEDGARAIGTVLGKGGAVWSAVRGGQVYRGEATILGSPYFTQYNPLFDRTGSVVGVLYVGQKKDAFDVSIADTNQANLRTAGSVTAGILLFAFLAVRLGARPLRRVTRAVGALANDDLSAEIPHADRRDEVGDIARALAKFKDRAERELHRAGSLGGLAGEFQAHVQTTLGTVTEALDMLRTTSAALTVTSNATQARVEIASTASDQASLNIQTVSGATEELSSSIGEINRQVAQSSLIASRAVGEAGETNARVQSLSAAANKIGEVVALISAIAEQTNLLALNATIEAARAGDAGRGFTVVASEMKSLATQMARATEEIAKQITTMQIAMAGAVDAISAINGTIGEMDGISNAIAASVAQQSAAAQEIARSIEAVAGHARHTRESLAEVRGAAAQTSTSSGAAASAAEAAAAEATRLDDTVRTFLSRMRAA